MGDGAAFGGDDLRDDCEASRVSAFIAGRDAAPTFTTSAHSLNGGFTLARSLGVLFSRLSCPLKKVVGQHPPVEVVLAALDAVQRAIGQAHRSTSPSAGPPCSPIPARPLPAAPAKLGRSPLLKDHAGTARGSAQQPSRSCGRTAAAAGSPTAPRCRGLAAASAGSFPNSASASAGWRIRFR